MKTALVTVSLTLLLLLLPDGLQSFQLSRLSCRNFWKKDFTTTVDPNTRRVLPSTYPSFECRVTASPTLDRIEHHPSAAEWHRTRRKQMLARYESEIGPLERESTSQYPGFPLLVGTCASLWILAVTAASLPLWGVGLISIFPGSILSLWQLQLLHDVLHGAMFDKKSTRVGNIPKQQWQEGVLFWASMPSVFGYYLYLKAGHLSHHRNVGEYALDRMFDSDQYEFEDGDLLFVAHRMKLQGDYGPKIPIPFTKDKFFKMSVSKSGFFFWRDGAPLANAVVFSISFLYERLLLVCNDVIVSLMGTNLFFPNKPAKFQNDCATYARVATALRGVLLFFFGWKPLIFLFLSETLWSLPPHPACAMFVTNHGSNMGESFEGMTSCAPTKSTYAGAWYSILTMGTNYHCEHHDFPTIPFHQLHKLRKIAPEYYPKGSSDDLLAIMKKAFGYPEFYACSGVSPGLSR